LARKRNATLLPRTRTWLLRIVVIPKVRNFFAYRSSPALKPAEVDQAHGDRSRPFEAERLLLDVLGHRLPQARKVLGEADELVELRLLLSSPEFGWYRYCRRPARSTPVAWSFALARGVIQTSRQAGGIRSDSIRARASSSAMRRPRAFS
jgi:hypothetical protein